MAAIDQGHLEFRGNDAVECETFIASVIKYAFAQGKQRDDAWIADFAATCMAQDALRWWGSLEEEVQQSWKLLQKEMFLAYPPMFHGKSGEEAEKFVQMIYRRARDTKRQGDARWIVEFVQTCLAGEALRWYATLEPDVQDNWKLLQQAILNRWPGNGDSSSAISSSSIFPTPAPAAAPAVIAPRQKGRIRVARKRDQKTYYLSNTLNAYGFPTLLTNAALALVVELEPASTGLWKLCIAEDQSIGYESLAIWWSGVVGDNYAALCAADSQTGKASADAESFTGSLLATVWRLSSDSSRDIVTNRKLTATSDQGDLFACTVGTASTVLFYTNPLSSGSSNLYFEPV